MNVKTAPIQQDQALIPNDAPHPERITEITALATYQLETEVEFFEGGNPLINVTFQTDALVADPSGNVREHEDVSVQICLTISDACSLVQQVIGQLGDALYDTVMAQRNVER